MASQQDRRWAMAALAGYRVIKDDTRSKFRWILLGPDGNLLICNKHAGPLRREAYHFMRHHFDIDPPAEGEH